VCVYDGLADPKTAGVAAHGEDGGPV
jgi:hypothetical protein